MALIENVDPAIELIEGRFEGERGATELAYLRSHAYFNQLAPADACVGALVDDELQGLLGAIIDVPDDRTVALRTAVATTITASYLTMMSTEDPPGSDWTPDRDADSLWRFWNDHLGPGAILAFGLPARFADSVARDGGRRLEA